MSNQWSENLRKRMETHQEPSPKGLWEDIEQRMKQDATVKFSSAQRPIVLWAKRIGAVAAVVLAMLWIGDALLKEKNPGELPPESREDEPVVGDDPFGDILVENKYREVYTDVRHKQPIIVGASVNYNLDDKWSLTGGLVEKNVSGKLTTDYFLDNTLIFGHEDKISIDPLQWSLNASVGVQYNFTPTIGLYAEPGLSYYFQNGSEVETIYKEKPVHFSLRFGLRFSLL